MKIAVAITGYPGTGKTTLVKRIIGFLQEREINILGFYTEEVREKGKRTGFDIITVPDYRRIPLARIGENPPRVGKYSVFTENLDEICRKLSKKDFRGIYVLDELGKMELFSHEFINFMEKVLEGHFILTYGLKLRHPLKDKLLSLPELKKFEITIHTREKLFLSLRQFLEKTIPGI